MCDLFGDGLFGDGIVYPVVCDETTQNGPHPLEIVDAFPPFGDGFCPYIHPRPHIDMDIIFGKPDKRHSVKRRPDNPVKGCITKAKKVKKVNCPICDADCDDPLHMTLRFDVGSENVLRPRKNKTLH
jgi:hypothetical protein